MGCLPNYTTFDITNYSACNLEVWIEVSQCSTGDTDGSGTYVISPGATFNFNVPGWISPNPDIDIIITNVGGTPVFIEFNPCQPAGSCLPGQPAATGIPTGDPNCPTIDIIYTAGTTSVDFY